MTTYHGHQIEIGAPRREQRTTAFGGNIVRSYRAIHIDGKYVCEYQHKSYGRALNYAYQIIEAREAEEDQP